MVYAPRSLPMGRSAHVMVVRFWTQRCPTSEHAGLIIGAHAHTRRRRRNVVQLDDDTLRKVLIPLILVPRAATLQAFPTRDVGSRGGERNTALGVGSPVHCVRIQRGAGGGQSQPCASKK